MMFIEASILGMVFAFVAGYILHGWEFDRELEKVEKRIKELEKQL